MSKLIVGGVPEHFNLPWVLAIEAGVFERAGLTVEWREFPEGTGAMMRAVEGREVDVALVLSEGAVAHIASNQSTGIIGTWVESPLVWGIHSGPKTIKGKRYPHDARIGISRYGSGSHLMPLVHAHQAGYADAAKFVEIATLAGAIEAFAQDAIDTFYWERTMTLPQVQANEMVLDGDFSAPWPAFVAVRSLDADPALTALWASTVELMAKHLASLLDAPAEFLALVGERFSLPAEEVQQWFERTRWNASLGVDGAALERAAEALVSAGVLSERVFAEALIVTPGVQAEV